MLTSLFVNNLAIVENAQVEFAPGLNVITGETGAGKSILINALSLVLGERADRDLLRAGAETGGAQACFQLADSSAVDEILEECGLPPCEDGRLVIRRLVRASGTSTATINDQPATLQTLKRLGAFLVDLHGPHDHQSILDPEAQLNLLDAFGHTWALREAYEEAHARVLRLEEQLRELEREQATPEQIEFLEHRIREIETAAPQEGEEEQLQEEHRVLAQAHRVLELGGEIVQRLQDAEASAFDQIAGAQRALQELSRITGRAEEWSRSLEGIAAQLQELALNVRDFLDRVEADPQRLAWLEERLWTYQRLKRKYGATVREILAALDQAKARLQQLQTLGQRRVELEQALAQAILQREQRGLDLRQRRAACADRLAEAVTRELRALGFPHGAFTLRLTPSSQPKTSGLDDIEFEFAPNPGEPPRALRLIASSGEISRVVLAAKAVLAAHDRIPVMVFDEIDANVGGELGTAVGRKLAEVARRHQVLCITHLPQVAVHGTHHLAVRKLVRGGRTIVEVRPLSAAERVEEIARMLGGREITTVAMKHARELLEKSAGGKAGSAT